MLPTLLSRRARPSETPWRSKISRASAAEASASSYLPSEIRLCSAPFSVRATSTSRPGPPEQLRRRVVVFQGLAILAAR